RLSLAAILLGSMLNALDAVSMGLLIFPSNDPGMTFSGLQTQAISLFIMSTIISQLTLSLGGSLFSGVLGSMLLEILPFLREIASTIQRKLPDKEDAVLPTVMAAYAVTSLTLGAVLALICALRWERFVEYFPRVVLRGVIGAIGISLCVLALELTLPASAPQLTLETAANALFSGAHLPLLGASVGPAFFLSISSRMKLFSKVTGGLTQQPLYIPIYCLVVGSIFWVVTAVRGYANASGLLSLASKGWLFTVENYQGENQTSYMAQWNYWALFNFNKVQWSVIPAATSDIVLLVLIGTITLPISVTSLALDLNVPVYEMNHEFGGHGLSNLLAGAAGTVPNMMVFSSSRFFMLSGGGHAEAMLVLLITIAIFFVSSFLLPYIPTILAATLLFFLGIELLASALWDSIRCLLWGEWITVLATVIGCTFLGVLPGIGLGTGLVLVLQFSWTIYDSRPRVVKFYRLDEGEVVEHASGPPSFLPPIKRDAYDLSSSLEDTSISSTKEIAIMKLTGVVGSATVPWIDTALKDILASRGRAPAYLVLDLETVTRIETDVARLLTDKAKKLIQLVAPTCLIICGLRVGSQVYADLERG
ncbi:hypothetical protein K469DRAFT_500916, partial [Zopfia rhizophila CBS 207.26]